MIGVPRQNATIDQTSDDNRDNELNQVSWICLVGACWFCLWVSESVLRTPNGIVRIKPAFLVAHFKTCIASRTLEAFESTFYLMLRDMLERWKPVPKLWPALGIISVRLFQQACSMHSHDRTSALIPWNSVLILC